jgi:hypothetical protein
MIKQTIELLKIASEENWKGDSIDIALGKNKILKNITDFRKYIKRR